MARFKRYSVYFDPNAAKPMETAQFVREGFHVWAFLLGVIWALYHRLWLVALVTTMVMVLIKIAHDDGWLLPVSLGIIELGYRIALGLLAPELRAAGLKRRGYVLADIVAGESLMASQQRYFDRVLSAGA